MSVPRSSARRSATPSASPASLRTDTRISEKAWPASCGSIRRPLFRRRISFSLMSLQGEKMQITLLKQAVMASTALLLALSALPAAAKDTVKLAFIGPLSGGVSANGVGGRNSADLAVKLRNADPKSKYNYELVSLDDECKPNVGVQVATKVAADNSIIAGVTHYCSAVAMATVDVYHKFGLS